MAIHEYAPPPMTSASASRSKSPNVALHGSVKRYGSRHNLLSPAAAAQAKAYSAGTPSTAGGSSSSFCRPRGGRKSNGFSSDDGAKSSDARGASPGSGSAARNGDDEEVDELDLQADTDEDADVNGDEPSRSSGRSYVDTPSGKNGHATLDIAGTDPFQLSSRTPQRRGSGITLTRPDVTPTSTSSRGRHSTSAHSRSLSRDSRLSGSYADGGVDEEESMVLSNTQTSEAAEQDEAEHIGHPNGQGAEGSMDVDADGQDKARSRRGGSSTSSRHFRLNGHAASDSEGSSEGEEDFWSDDEADEAESRPVVHVEVRLPPFGPATRIADHSIESMLRAHIASEVSYLQPESVLDLSTFQREFRAEGTRAGAAAKGLGSLERVWIGEATSAASSSMAAAGLVREQLQLISPFKANVRLHMYRCALDDVENFTAVVDPDDEDTAVPAASVRHLPSVELEGQWENLVYPDNIKERLLGYISSMKTMSRKGVDPNVVTNNRLVLLHGPPGTGKTSLCRALAQKMIIRAGKQYPQGGRLVEINSHSLFSKWFSESGKLVQKLFSTITDMVADPECFVFVMIDEVESLTAARSGMGGGNEPGDAIRVVNALLTQLDKLRAHPNVLVLATSNIPNSIDAAFVDRADIKQYVPLPGPQAVYWMLRGCLLDLQTKGLVKRTTIPDWSEAGMAGIGRASHIETSKRRRGNGGQRVEGDASRARGLLRGIAEKCHQAGCAGRFLRRLPTLAYAEFIDPLQAIYDDPPARSLGRWLEAMDKRVDMEIADRGRIVEEVSTKMADAAGMDTKGGVTGNYE